MTLSSGETNISLPMITHVAVRYKGFAFSLPRPFRHHHVHNCLIHLVGGINDFSTDGFLTNKYFFLNRKEAFSLVSQNGQLLRKDITDNKLFSEDVWVHNVPYTKLEEILPHLRFNQPLNENLYESIPNIDTFRKLFDKLNVGGQND